MLEVDVGCASCCPRPSLTLATPGAVMALGAFGGYALPGSDSNGTQQGMPFEMLN